MKQKGTKSTSKERCCSFCGRPQSQVDMLFQGMIPEALLCNHCVDMGYESLHGITTKSTAKQTKQAMVAKPLYKPSEIKEFLDRYVVGQDAAKRYISVAVYNHYKRLQNSVTNSEEGVELDKSNMILVGPTGTGKTLIARTIARLLDVPFAIVDATALTQAGYVGEDVEGILSRLYQAADYNKERTEKGIIFIDEIDKIARKGDNPSITRDVSGEGVQQALLKILEGSIVNVPPQGGRKHPEQQFVQIDTRNILFMCGGAFDGIERRIAERLNTRAIGYGRINTESIDRDNLLRYVLPQDIKSYGLIPELVGRLPVLTHMEPLTRETLRNILTEPKNAIIRQYQHLFAMDAVELSFDDEVLDYIVDKALQFKLGARGLRSICETIMMDVMFDTPTSKDKKVVITLDYAKSKMEQSAISEMQKAV
ncbi:MAG: ATP-dependent Clp protease ATP-binding subunit ClpX [Alistipes sp.]|nr:ATP-dependent Clp protease ATP-binding subunit ClpX [Alistipes sp.]